MSTDLWLDFPGIRLNSRKAEGMKFVIDLVTPDNGEKYVVEMSNATPTNIKGFQAKNPDLTITINRSDPASPSGTRSSRQSRGVRPGGDTEQR